MYLDPEDKEKIIQYLIDNKGHFSTLKPIKILSKMRDKLLKKYDSSFHEEINIQYDKQCRLVVGTEISKNTGLAIDGIMYVLEYMGLENFKNYLE